MTRWLIFRSPVERHESGEGECDELTGGADGSLRETE